MLPVLVFVFLVVPLAEVFVLIQVGHVIGGWNTLALLIADALVGSWLFRREGVRAWRALQVAMTEGRLPGQEIANAALVLVGGVLLVTPGLLTDVVGLACVLPVTRPLVRRLLLRTLARRLALPDSGPSGNRPRWGPDTDPPDANPVINGEVIDPG